MKSTVGWAMLLLHKMEQGFSFDEACILCKVGKDRVYQQEKIDPEFSQRLSELRIQNAGRRISW